MPKGENNYGTRFGGRKKGTPNKKTREFRDSVAAAGITPLEYMLAVLRDEKAPEERRDEMAKAAAPFIHPRLAAMKVSGDPNAPLFDLSSLTDSELAFLRRTILKARQIEESTVN